MLNSSQNTLDHPPCLPSWEDHRQCDHFIVICKWGTASILQCLKNRTPSICSMQRWSLVSILGAEYPCGIFQCTSSIQRCKKSAREWHILVGWSGDQFVTQDIGHQQICWPVWTLLHNGRVATHYWSDLRTHCNRDHHWRSFQLGYIPRFLVVPCPQSFLEVSLLQTGFDHWSMIILDLLFEVIVIWVDFPWKCIEYRLAGYSHGVRGLLP